MSATALNPELPAPAKTGLPPAVRRAISVIIVLLAMCGLWEGYKAIGEVTGNKIPFTEIPLPIRSTDNSMPHVWRMAATLFEPARRGGEEILLVILLRNALFTWREALVGFVIGSLIGFMLGVLFVHSSLLERGLMPYVVASQTVPLLAIAPMVVIWGSRLGWPAWASVTVISAYLTFFPVTINTLRGLTSPEATALELMRSYAASRWEVLWKLRVPAALPYIFTALKISATTSVIGAIVGELPSGIPDGLGRSLLTFAQYFSTGPEQLFAAVFISALLGIVFFGLVAFIERLVIPPSRRLE